MTGFLALLPGGIGAAMTLAVFADFNAPGWPREYEAAVAIAAGLIAYGVAALGVRRLALQENQIEAMLENAGIDPHYEAMRTGRVVAEGRARLKRMHDASRGRTEPLKEALADLEAKMEPLFAEMLTAPETARRADEIFRRILPRLEATFLEYCDYAGLGDGVIDTVETRNRVIAALNNTSETAERARRAVIETTGETVDVSLSVLENTLARQR